MTPMSESRIHVGVGGWTFEPWRDNFYPKGLPHSRELHYASRALTAIEINGTYYSTFKPDHFAKWAAETPDGFVFSMKANRFATNRKLLATAGESIQRFVGSGIARLGDKLGPIVWQLMPTKKFESEDFAAFLALLPREVEGRPLRHVIDARHASFGTEECLALLHRHGCAIVHTDSPDYPPIADTGSDMAYLRLMRTDAAVPSGYPPEELAKWCEGAKAWTAKGPKREVFMYFISGAKEKAPAAAQHALALLRTSEGGPGPVR
jgi:uncharacterized protein YecE (DUF72 family)